MADVAGVVVPVDRQNRKMHTKMHFIQDFLRDRGKVLMNIWQMFNANSQFALMHNVFKVKFQIFSALL